MSAIFRGFTVYVKIKREEEEDFCGTPEGSYEVLCFIVSALLRSSFRDSKTFVRCYVADADKINSVLLLLRGKNSSGPQA